MTLSTSLPSNPNWPYPQSATLYLTTTSSVSFPYALRTPNATVGFTFTLTLECAPELQNAGNYSQCLSWYAATYVPPAAQRFVWATDSIISTAAGPGGCRGSGFRPGHQRKDYPLVGDDLPILTSYLSAGFATPTAWISQDRYSGGITQFDFQSSNLTMLTGQVDSLWMNRDGNGSYALWDARHWGQIPQAWDGNKYTYSTAFGNAMIRRVNVATGYTTTVFGAEVACPGAKWDNYQTIPACWTPDGVCGTSARMATLSEMAAERRGRYLYIADSSSCTIRQISTTTWCPVTMWSPTASTPYPASRLIAHPDGLHLYAFISSLAVWYRFRVGVSMVYTVMTYPVASGQPTNPQYIFPGPDGACDAWFELVFLNTWTYTAFPTMRIRRWPLTSTGLGFQQWQDIFEVRSDYFKDGHYSIAGIKGQIPASTVAWTAGGELMFVDPSERLRKINLETGMVTSIFGGGEQEVCGGITWPYGGLTATGGLISNGQSPLSGPVDGVTVKASFSAAGPMVYAPLNPSQSMFEHPLAYILDNVLFGGVRQYNMRTGMLSTIYLTSTDPVNWPMGGNLYAIGISPIYAARLMFVATGSYLMQCNMDTWLCSYFAGQRWTQSGTDGTARQASFNNPQQIVFDNAGAFMYIADRNSYSVRRVRVSDGETVTMAGGGPGGGVTGERTYGYGVQALMGSVQSIAYDPTSTPGNERLFVLTNSPYHIHTVNLNTRRVDATWGSFGLSCSGSSQGYFNQVSLCSMVRQQHGSKHARRRAAECMCSDPISPRVLRLDAYVCFSPDCDDDFPDRSVSGDQRLRV